MTEPRATAAPRQAGRPAPTDASTGMPINSFAMLTNRPEIGIARVAPTAGQSRPGRRRNSGGASAVLPTSYTTSRDTTENHHSPWLKELFDRSQK